MAGWEWLCSVSFYGFDSIGCILYFSPWNLTSLRRASSSGRCCSFNGDGAVCSGWESSRRNNRCTCCAGLSSSNCLNFVAVANLDVGIRYIPFHCQKHYSYMNVIISYRWWTRIERASEFGAVWVCKECEEDGMNISSWNYFVVCAFRCCSCRILVYKKVVASLGRIASNMRGRQTRKCCFGVAKSDEEPGKRSSSSCTIDLLSNNSLCYSKLRGDWMMSIIYRQRRRR